MAIEEYHGKLVIHNYGAGSAGYQSSWLVHCNIHEVSTRLTYELGVWPNMLLICFPRSQTLIAGY